jgi:hypothetical protein
MQIHVLLKDGTYLNCVIFDDIYKQRIDDIETIKLYFSKDYRCYDNFMQDMIWFQTQYINGHFHPCNVLWYEIQEVNNLR